MFDQETVDEMIDALPLQVQLTKATLKASNDLELMQLQASYVAKYVDVIMQYGFERSEAIQIACATLRAIK